MSHRILLALAVALTTALVSSTPALAGGGAATGCSTPALAIPDDDPLGTTDVIMLATSLTVGDAQIGVDITHSWHSDITAIVDSPGAAVSVTLTSGSGGSADDVFVTFASTGIPFDEALMAAGLGTLMDAQGPGAMADFHGLDSAGDWTLFLSDSAGGDTGTLNEWCITLDDAAPITVASGCSTPALAIPDSDLVGTSDVITLTDSLTVADAQASLDITHTFQADLDITLDSPGAAVSIILTADSGGGADNVLVTFASTGVAFDGGLLFDGLGTLMQAQGPGAMSDFHGLDSAGDWTLNLVDDAGGDTGTLNEWCITLDSVAPPPPPAPNDLCDGAIALDSGVAVAFDTSGGSGPVTASGVNPGCGGGTAPTDLWYSFVAPCDGDTTISLCDSDYDTRVAVYEGDCLTLTVTACNDDECGTRSEVTFAAVGGTSYLVQVGGFNSSTGTGNVLLLTGPANGNCADAEFVTDGSVAWDNTCASQSGQNPGCGSTFTDPFDLWYEYTASCDGDLTIDTFGSGFDTRVAVWADCGDPAPIACDDDTGGPQSEVVLTGVVSGTVYLIQVGGFAGATGADGVLNVQCGLPDVLAVSDLTCTAEATGFGDVSWTNNDAYDGIEVYVDGLLTFTLMGTDTSVMLTGLVPFATTEICVRAILAGTNPVDTCCSVVVPGDTSNLVVVVDGDTGGDLDSTAAVSAALTANGVTHTILNSIDQINGTPLQAFVLLGSFPNNTALTSDEGQTLADIQAAGCPIAISSGDTWGFDAATAFNDGDGVDPAAADGDDSFTGMIGANVFAGFDAAYSQDAVGIDYNDQIAAAAAGTELYGDDHQIAFSDDGSGGSVDPYDTGVSYLTPTGIGNVLATSWELAGYGGDQDALMAAILGFLDLTPEPVFQRGDSNADGVFDVADPTYTLTYLFSAGSAHTCDDAADSNDDGQLNLGDPVFSVTALFSGGPAPAAPGIGPCGVDPTADALGCEDYAGCGLK